MVPYRTNDAPRVEQRTRLAGSRPYRAVTVLVAFVVVGAAACAGAAVRWTEQPVPVPTSTSSGPVTVAMEQVACVTRAACVGVGAQRQADGVHVVTWSWNGSAWSLASVRPAATDPLTSLSCATAAFCAAASPAGIETFDGRSWLPATVTGTANRVAGTTVACASTIFCLAAGGGGTWRWDGSGWRSAGAPPAVVGGTTTATFRGLTCPVAGACLAVGIERQTDGTVVNVEHVWEAGAWRRAVLDVPMNGTVDDLACGVGAGSCLLVGRGADRTTGFALRGGAGRWSDAALTGPSSAHDLDAECVTTQFCVVLRRDAMSAILTPAGWIGGPPAPVGGFLDTACVIGWCVAVGGELSAQTGDLRPRSASVAVPVTR